MRPLQSYRLDTDANQQTDSPELVSPADTRPRKPPHLLRRTSTKFPRRGQEFSVDDDSTEVEAQSSQLEQSKRATATGSMRSAPGTIRRRATAHTPRLPFVESSGEGEETETPQPTPQIERKDFEPSKLSRRATADDSKLGAKDTERNTTSVNADDEDDTPSDENADDDDDDADLSDAESFTLKDRQEAINETHPFGIRIWKPALYKKGRSVEKDAEGDIHSAPGGNVSRWLLLFNYAWVLIFGWWLALVAAVGALLCYVFAFAPGCRDYGTVLWGLARYIFYPFGKYVKLIQEEAYAHEDEGEGRSISEYERWQQGDLEEGRLFFGPVRSLIGRRSSEDNSDDETTSLLGRNARAESPLDENGNKTKRRLFGRGQWNLGRVIFFVFFYGLITPLLFLVSMICWLLVFTIPMARVTLILLRHLRHRPLALEFHSDSTYTRGAGAAPSAIILCTYRAVGTKYWKYTIDGTNIFLINLLGVVAFVIFDYWVLYVALGLRIMITNTIFVFLLALFSIIPLAYFIGQAVASISAQSTMGVGAAINAFFSTIVEVFLYCVALNEGKSRLVEGSLIGSIFAGILLLPGISMCFGAIKRKTQRFNVRSAGVTTTMLLFAVIGCFSPTLFYEIYGSVSRTLPMLPMYLLTREISMRSTVINARTSMASLWIAIADAASFHRSRRPTTHFTSTLYDHTAGSLRSYCSYRTSLDSCSHCVLMRQQYGRVSLTRRNWRRWRTCITESHRRPTPRNPQASTMAPTCSKSRHQPLQATHSREPIFGTLIYTNAYWDSR